MKLPFSIPKTTTRILDSGPDPVIQYKLRRDVLHEPMAELVHLKTQFDSSPWVKQLVNEQHPDGSWGRFHSRDSQSKQKIITTELGVDRGLVLGLDASHPAFCRTVDYLTQLISGQISFPDRAERNNRWPIGVQLFTAATFSRLKPNHPFLDDAWELWAEIAARTFASGKYDPNAEILAHKELTGVSIKDSYLVLKNKYTLVLLSSRIKELSVLLGKQILKWILTHPDGVQYLGVPAEKLSFDAPSSKIDRWFSTHELLSRFPAWKDLAGEIVDWLWAQQGNDGLWDFGPRSVGSHYLPLSPNWRKPIHRKIDWSTRILCLLAQYYN